MTSNNEFYIFLKFKVSFHKYMLVIACKRRKTENNVQHNKH